MDNNEFGIQTENFENNIKPKKNMKIILIILFLIALLVIGILIINKDKGKEDNKNPDNTQNNVEDKKEENNEDIKEDVTISQQLYLDYKSGKITTDQYVRYNLYAQYDISLLNNYKITKNNGFSIHVDELIEKYYDELSDETLRYYIDKVNLSNVTFELDEKQDVSFLNLSVDKLNVEEDTTNLDNAILSSNGNFVVWYTTTGASATNYEMAKKVADGLEKTVYLYKEKFGFDFQYESHIYTKGKRYQQQQKVLENSNIDVNYLESAMQVYLVNYKGDTLGLYTGGVGSFWKVWNKLMGGDKNGVIANPYIMIKPSAISDYETLEQIYNHELFHHYQYEIISKEYNGTMTDPYVGEATAHLASALSTNKTNNIGLLNKWAGTARKYSSNLLSQEMIDKYGKTDLGYALFVYFYNYSEFVNDGLSKIMNSICQSDALKYLQDNATKEELRKIQANIAYQNLAQTYENKNLIVGDPNNPFEIQLKKTIKTETTISNVDIEVMALDYYLLDISSKEQQFEIELLRNNEDINISLIGEINGEYNILDTSLLKKDNAIFNTNYYDDYDKLYIVVYNSLLKSTNNYSIKIKALELKEEVPPANDNVNNEYIELEIFDYMAKFKKNNPTNYWDCDDNFGALEVYKVYIPSPNGVAVNNYYDKIELSNIVFQVSDSVIEDAESIKSSYKTFYNIDVDVANINKGIFTRHIKGESSSMYVESYCFKYNELYFEILLVIYKKDYNSNFIQKLIAEYNTIINTFEIK